MSGVVNPYDGSILFERVLKANLPAKTSGKKIFFVVNQPTDTVGEIWATNNEGTVVCYSVAVDVQTLNAAMGAFQKQLANLTETDTSLLNKINDCSKNKVLTTLEEVNNPNLESGIYSAEGEGVRMSFSTSVSSDYYVLIVNKHRLNPGYGTQLAIPYDNAAQRGIYYRICAAGTWSPWRTIATPESEMITLNGFTPSFTQCKVSKVGNVYTFNFSIVTTGAIPSGTVIATLPTGFYPTYNFHIHPWAYNADVSYHLRAWVTTDGNITLHGGETLQPDVQLEFSRTMIFE